MKLHLWMHPAVKYTRGVQKVRRPTQLTTRYAHHILSLFDIFSCNWNAAFLQSSDSVVKNCCSWSSSQPFAVQITFSSPETLCPFMNSFSLGKKQKSLGARTTHLITRQLKHWLPSKMPALNYSVTHCIRHSYSYCTVNDWLEDEEQQFFYNEIRALKKC